MHRAYRRGPRPRFQGSDAGYPTKAAHPPVPTSHHVGPSRPVSHVSATPYSISIGHPIGAACNGDDYGPIEAAAPVRLMLPNHRPGASRFRTLELRASSDAPSPRSGPPLSPAASPTVSPTASLAAGLTASPTASPTASTPASPTASPTASLTTGPTLGPTRRARLQFRLSVRQRA